MPSTVAFIHEPSAVYWLRQSTTHWTHRQRGKKKVGKRRGSGRGGVRRARGSGGGGEGGGGEGLKESDDNTERVEGKGDGGWGERKGRQQERFVVVVVSIYLNKHCRLSEWATRWHCLTTGALQSTPWLILFVYFRSSRHGTFFFIVCCSQHRNSRSLSNPFFPGRDYVRLTTSNALTISCQLSESVFLKQISSNFFFSLN